MKRLLAGLMAVGLICVAVAAGRQTGASGSTPKPASQLDVEIAIDGTESMAGAIAQAQAAGVGIANGVLSLLPDTRFSVVVFRDHGNPAGEYELMQPFTNDADAVKTALGKIKGVYNPSPDNGLAESYNLAFRNSYSDPTIGWRPSSRKIVLVLGDAEPNGAGNENMAGCHDHSRDPEGLSTRQELANMRAAHRTLIMVRELTKDLSVTLQCYQALAAGAYAGGAGRDATGDFVANIVELIQGAYAPLTLKSDLPVALRSDRIGYTVKLQNPNLSGLTTNSASIQLPRGFLYLPKTTTGATTADPQVSGRTLTWSFTRVLQSHQRLRIHFAVRTPRQIGAYVMRAVASVETTAGTQLLPRTPFAVLRVRRRIKTIAFGFEAKTRAGLQIDGWATARFGARQIVSSRVGAHGTIVVRTAHGTRLFLRVRGLRLDRLATPTRAHLTLRVASAPGLRSCTIGSKATLLLVGSAALRQDDTSAAYLSLSLPRSCGGPSRSPADIAVSDS